MPSKRRRLLGLDDLRERGLTWSRRHLKRLEDKNQFPKRVPIGAHRIGWVEDEIDQHILDRIMERR